uniref:Uncharacterized protein n=1 Tax=Lactuca sativa TaxID=4236 RepID=A0A9R1WA00_LACSA|nr:hypothetical protein LSAT_V11C300137090 [Lactuca sativa]
MNLTLYPSNASFGALRVPYCMIFILFFQLLISLLGTLTMIGPLSHAIIIFGDNVSVMYLDLYLIPHQRTKHMEVYSQFVREYVMTGHVHV